MLDLCIFLFWFRQHDFSLEKARLWIIYIEVFYTETICLDVLVSYKHSFLIHKTLIVGLYWCGLLVDYCDVFNQLFELSFWRHPFTAEDPLLSKWCNTKLLQIFYNSQWNETLPESSSSLDISIWKGFKMCKKQQCNFAEMFCRTYIIYGRIGKLPMVVCYQNWHLRFAVRRMNRK